MTPKQEAREIYNMFYGIPLYIRTIKECCYITVDRILNMDYPSATLEDLSKHIAHWEEVKKEIEIYVPK